MTTFSERQWNAARMLLCDGDPQHIAPLPHVRSCDGATGAVVCTECGEPMMLVDVLVIDGNASWNNLSDRAPLYTTAKLHPINLLTGLARASSAGETPDG